MAEKDFIGRTSYMLSDRWRSRLHPTLKHQPWTDYEIQKLINWVEKHGTSKWVQATKVIKGRTRQEIRVKWNSLQDVASNKIEWTAEEEK
jgi:hypothetical protein